MDGGGCSRTTEPPPRSINTLHGSWRMLSDDGDSSTSGRYPPRGDRGCSRTTETNLPPIETSMDVGGFSQTTETPPRTVETIHGWWRLLLDDGDYSTDGGDLSWIAEAALG